MDIKNGILCLTFDDRNFDGWIEALPIFEKYHAHVSFFVCGEINDEALSAIRKLHKAGHTIGLHTRYHSDAPEYFETNGADAYYKNEIEQELQKLNDNGISVRSFGYPNNKRTEETDSYLSKYFNRFRAGNSNFETKYIPVDMLEKVRIMRGFGIGEYYKTTDRDIIDKIVFASKNNLCATFFSHNIVKNATHIDMSTELLEKCLETALREGVKVLGFDQLP